MKLVVSDTKAAKDSKGRITGENRVYLWERDWPGEGERYFPTHLILLQRCQYHHPGDYEPKVYPWWRVLESVSRAEAIRVAFGWLDDEVLLPMEPQPEGQERD